MECIHIACKIAKGDITELAVPYIKIILTNSFSNSEIRKFVQLMNWCAFFLWKMIALQSVTLCQCKS